jgi:hypothetical protein
MVEADWTSWKLWFEMLDCDVEFRWRWILLETGEQFDRVYAAP